MELAKSWIDHQLAICAASALLLAKLAICPICKTASSLHEWLPSANDAKTGKVFSAESTQYCNAIRNRITQEHKITAGHPSAIFHAFQPDGCSSYLLVGHSVQAKVSKNYQYGLDRNIYSHLYSLLKFYLIFYVNKRANELLCSLSCCSFDFSVAKSKWKCCVRCSRAPVVKLIDLVCSFHSTAY